MIKYVYMYRTSSTACSSIAEERVFNDLDKAVDCAKAKWEELGNYGKEHLMKTEPTGGPCICVYSIEIPSEEAIYRSNSRDIIPNINKYFKRLEWDAADAAWVEKERNNKFWAHYNNVKPLNEKEQGREYLCAKNACGMETETVRLYDNNGNVKSEYFRLSGNSNMVETHRISMGEYAIEVVLGEILKAIRIKKGDKIVEAFNITRSHEVMESFIRRVRQDQRDAATEYTPEFNRSFTNDSDLYMVIGDYNHVGFAGSEEDAQEYFDSLNLRSKGWSSAKIVMPHQSVGFTEKELIESEPNALTIRLSNLQDELEEVEKELYRVEDETQPENYWKEFDEPEYLLKYHYLEYRQYALKRNIERLEKLCPKSNY